MLVKALNYENLVVKIYQSLDTFETQVGFETGRKEIYRVKVSEEDAIGLAQLYLKGRNHGSFTGRGQMLQELEPSLNGNTSNTMILPEQFQLPSPHTK